MRDRESRGSVPRVSISCTLIFSPQWRNTHAQGKFQGYQATNGHERGRQRLCGVVGEDRCNCVHGSRV